MCPLCLMTKMCWGPASLAEKRKSCIPLLWLWQLRSLIDGIDLGTLHTEGLWYIMTFRSSLPGLHTTQLPFERTKRVEMTALWWRTLAAPGHDPGPFPAPTGQLTSIPTSNFMGSFSGLRRHLPCRCYTYIHSENHSHRWNKHKCLNL